MEKGDGDGGGHMPYPRACPTLRTLPAGLFSPQPCPTLPCPVRFLTWNALLRQ